MKILDSNISIYKNLLLFFIIMNLISCEESIPWELSPEANDKLVVDAVITNELITQQIYLNLSYSQLNGIAPNISDASVLLVTEEDSINFVHSQTEVGLYQSEYPFAAQSNQTYLLRIIWKGESYSAQATMSTVYPLQPIKFAEVNGTDSLIITEIGPIYHPLQQARYDVYLDWNHIVPGPNSKATIYAYTFNTVDVSELIRPPMERIRFPRGTRLVEKKYGLTDQYGEYLRALVMETEWKGGVFDETSSSLPSNISNNALGFFAVCAVLSDTIIVQ